MLGDNKSSHFESVSYLEIPTVLNPPITLKFADNYISCPICEIDIDLKDCLIYNDTYAYCKDCNHKIIFKIVKI